MKNKIISVFLVITLFVTSFPMNAIAAESIDSQLISRGYPVQLIERLTDGEKYDLLNDDCYYESSKIYNYDENGELINIETFDENSITPYGQIKTSHLSLAIISSKSGSNTVITFKYNWKVLPLNRYQDPICVAWDKDIFSYKSGTFKKEDFYTKIINGTVYTHSSETAYANSGLDHISWYADLKGYSKLPEELFGYGKFTLVPKKTGKSTGIYGHYVHAKTSLSLSISYKGAGFSISGMSPYDELGTDITVKS